MNFFPGTKEYVSIAVQKSSTEPLAAGTVTAAVSGGAMPDQADGVAARVGEAAPEEQHEEEEALAGLLSQRDQLRQFVLSLRSAQCVHAHA